MNYVRLIAREALGRSIRVTISTLPGSTCHPSFIAMKEELGNHFETRMLRTNRRVERRINAGNLVVRQIGCRELFGMNVSMLSRADRPDMILVPYLEHCDKAVGALGSPFGDLPFSGITMKSRFHHRAMGIRSPMGRSEWIKERLFYRLLGIATLRTLFTIDEPLCDHVARTRPHLVSKLHLVPDPVDFSDGPTRGQSRKALGISDDAVVLLCYGVLSQRKGVEPLLEALQLCRSLDVTLLMAGEQDPTVRQTLRGPLGSDLRARGRLIEDDSFHVGANETAAFRASDIVWVGYRDFYGPSAVAVQAGAMGLPVVATREGLIGWMAARYELGPVVDVERPTDVAAAIAGLVKDPASASRFGANGARHALRHTGQSFGRRICDLLLDAEPAAVLAGREAEMTSR